MRRALFLAFLLAACAGDRAAPGDALPARVLDQARLRPGGPGEDVVARYGAASGSVATVFLTADPAAAGQPDGVGSPVLARHHARSLGAMLAGVAGQGGAPSAGDITVRLRDGRAEMRCGVTGGAGEGAIDTVCLSLVGGRVAKVRVTVKGMEGKTPELTRYAVEVSMRLILALRAASPEGAEAWEEPVVPPGPGAGPLLRT